MALNTNRTDVDFSFRHVEQVDKLGQSVGGVVATVQSLLDSRAEDNLTDVNNVKTTMRSVAVGDSGAKNIGASIYSDVVGTTVQAQLEEINNKSATAFPVLDGSLGDVKLSNTTGQIKDVVGDHTAQLAENVKKINRPLIYGELTMPIDFIPVLPCKFYRDHEAIIKHNMNFNKYKGGTKIYVTTLGSDTNIDGSIESPFLTLGKAVAVAIAGSDSKYTIYTSIATFNRGEAIFNQAVTNKTISIVSKGVLEETIKEANSIKYNLLASNLVGTWIISGNTNYRYTNTIGDSFSQNFNGTELIFAHYADTNGGRFDFVVDGDEVLKKTISTYSDVVTLRQQTVFSNLSEGTHTVKATFRGDDPLHTPTETARGWIRLTVNTDEWSLKSRTLDYTNAPIGAIDKTLITTNSTYAWTLDGTGTYKTTRTNTYNVVDAININVYNIPIPLKQVTSISLCQSELNTWYTDGTGVWVHRLDGSLPTILNTIVQINTLGIKPILDIGAKIYFENVIFIADANNAFNASNNSSIPYGEICFNSCIFIGAKKITTNNCGLAINGVKDTYVFSCISAYNQLDGFNYHYASITLANRRSCFVLEYNCKAIECGLITSAGNSNASSAHEGISILRINTLGSDTNGPVIVDVTGCYSILYDCNVRDSLTEFAFQFFSDGEGVGLGKTIMINCGASGCDTSLFVGTTHNAIVNNFKYDGIITNLGILSIA